jgi:hypothetical protein
VNETIELDTSLRAVWRWKWLVLAGAVVAAAIVAGLSASATPRYTTTALVGVGRVMGEELEDAFAVAQTINSPGFQAAMRARAGGPVPGTVQAEALTGGQGRLEHPTLVRITASAPSAEAAVAAGQAAVAELVARHAERYDQSVAVHREYERVLEAAADPTARKELFELRARLVSPVFTAPTAAKDAFPTPAAPVPKDTLLSASVAFAVTLAILVLLVVALAQVGPVRNQV